MFTVTAHIPHLKIRLFWNILPTCWIKHWLFCRLCTTSQNWRGLATRYRSKKYGNTMLEVIVFLRSGGFMVFQTPFYDQSGTYYSKISKKKVRNVGSAHIPHLKNWGNNNYGPEGQTERQFVGEQDLSWGPGEWSAVRWPKWTRYQSLRRSGIPNEWSVLR